MAKKKKLKQTKSAKARRRRYRANKKKRPAKKKKSKAGKRKGKHTKRGCGKHNWSKGGNARWKCKPGAKKHAYKSKK
jgi:hypothetical protein